MKTQIVENGYGEKREVKVMEGLDEVLDELQPRSVLLLRPNSNFGGSCPSNSKYEVQDPSAKYDNQSLIDASWKVAIQDTAKRIRERGIAVTELSTEYVKNLTDYIGSYNHTKESEFSSSVLKERFDSVIYVAGCACCVGESDEDGLNKIIQLIGKDRVAIGTHRPEHELALKKADISFQI